MCAPSSAATSSTHGSTNSARPRRRPTLIGSADLMPRNLDRRVEALVSVTDPALQDELDEMLRVNLPDDVLAWTLGEDGTWHRLDGRGEVDTHRRLQELALVRRRGDRARSQAGGRRRVRAPRSACGLPDLVVSEMADHDLDATYYDRVDTHLLDQGITVRRRTGEGTRWTVKLPTDEDPRPLGEPEAWPAARSSSTLTTSTSPMASRVPHPLPRRRGPRCGGPAALPPATVAARHPGRGDGGRDRRRQRDRPGARGGGRRCHLPGDRGRVRGGHPVGAHRRRGRGHGRCGARAGEPRSKIERALALLGRR